MKVREFSGNAVIGIHVKWFCVCFFCFPSFEVLCLLGVVVVVGAAQCGGSSKRPFLKGRKERGPGDKTNQRPWVWSPRVSVSLFYYVTATGFKQDD